VDVDVAAVGLVGFGAELAAVVAGVDADEPFEIL
jgi:hypothetical protein